MESITQVHLVDLINRQGPLWLVDLDCSNLCFRNAGLKLADFTGSKLVKTDFRNAELNGTILIDVDLSGADLSNAKLLYAKMHHANLEGANLQGAVLTGAILVGANLKKANLLGANLQDANLEGVVFENTILPSGKTR